MGPASIRTALDVLGVRRIEHGVRAIEDDAHFIDFERSAIWIGKEHLLIDRW